MEKIAVIGLGYVGLPIAVALAEKYGSVCGFDISTGRVEELKNGLDHTLEIEEKRLRNPNLLFFSNIESLKGCTFFIVTVPTPIDENNQPDLSPLDGASNLIGSVLQKNAIVCFESTVYPGVTEEFCGPILERVSGLKQGTDFKLAYSPERINPGDKEHTIERIIKVVSAQDSETLERVCNVYSSIIEVGLHQAPSIKVAETAKVLENTQRDLNIALMNELAIICDRLNMRTIDVLRAAGTKWNFLNFRPGLVGGHCIGVDPFYLTAKAQSLGYHPEVILSGRRINDGMGAFIAQKMVRFLARSEKPIKGARVGVLGLTFKENVPDTRNSRVPDIVRELESFGVNCLVHDPWVKPELAYHEYGITVCPLEDLSNLDGIVIAVMHQQFIELGPKGIENMFSNRPIILDIKSAFEPSNFGESTEYWSL